MSVPPVYTETEERIFHAALEVFSIKGKDGARMQEIADAAQINKAMLHYYFRSKEKLYEAVFEYVFSRWLFSLGEAIREAGTFADVLHAFIDQYTDRLSASPALIRLMTHENLAGAPVLSRKIESMGPAFHAASPPAVFVVKMRAAVAAGEIRDVDPVQTFLTIIGSMAFFFLSYPTFSVLYPSMAEDREAFVTARKEHLFDLIYHGLKL